MIFSKTYLDIGVGIWAVKNNKLKQLHLYLYLRHTAKDQAGRLDITDQLNVFSEATGMSLRTVKMLFKNLIKIGWITKWGNSHHIETIYKLREAMNVLRKDIQELTESELLQPWQIFKANLVEYIKAAVIRNKYYHFVFSKRSMKSALCEADQSWTRKRNLGDCSYRLTKEITGLSLSHIYYLTKIQTVSKYYHRFCPEFDKLNIKTRTQLKKYTLLAKQAGEEVQPSMFRFWYGKDQKFRKRTTDYIATSAEIKNRWINPVMEHIEKPIYVPI